MRPTDMSARRGAFVAVVGPSGAGKDTLLAIAREKLAADAGIVFVRRVVTRPAVSWLEDHDSLPVETFMAAERAGRFCVTWQAHGLFYGLPAALAGAYEGGATIVSNVSRAALGHIAARFSALHVIEITASRDILRRRLLSRGRETSAEVEDRLDRIAGPFPNGDWACTHIDNSGSAEDAAAMLLAAILHARRAQVPDLAT